MPRESQQCSTAVDQAISIIICGILDVHQHCFSKSCLKMITGYGHNTSKLRYCIGKAINHSWFLFLTWSQKNLLCIKMQIILPKSNPRDASIQQLEFYHHLVVYEWECTVLATNADYWLKISACSKRLL